MKKIIIIGFLLLSFILCKAQLFLIDIKNIPDTVKLSSWVETKTLTINAVNMTVLNIDNRIWTFQITYRIYRSKKHSETCSGDYFEMPNFVVRQYLYDNSNTQKPDIYLKAAIKADIKAKFNVQDSDIIFY